MTYPTTSPPGTENNDNDSDNAGAKEKATAVAGAAQEQAGAVAGTAKEQISNVTDSAKEQISSVAGTAGEQARNLVSEAQQEFTTQATAQKEKAVTGLRALSKDLASMAEHSEGGGVAGHVVSEAARRSGTLADYLDEREPGHLLEDLRSLGRRRTGGFLLGAAVLGFAGGRLLKGSKSDAGTQTEPAAAQPVSPVQPPETWAPAQDDDPTTLSGTYGSLIRTPSLMSPDDV